jgi:hypothetical protein
MRLTAWDRAARGRGGWTVRDADGRARFERGQRAAVADVDPLVT